MTRNRQAAQRRDIVQTLRAYGRGVLGALLVSMPLLVTMEMWWLGFTMPPWKLLVFLVLHFGVLLVLQHYSGFQEDDTFLEEVQDAISAYGIGLLVAALILPLFNILRGGMSLDEILGKILLQSIPLSLGASIAMAELGEQRNRDEQRKRQAGVLGSLAISLVGASYFGFNIAPTEEPLMLGARIHWWHAVLLLLAALLVAHAIVYALGFRGGRQLPEGSSWWGSILTFGVATTTVALLVAVLYLWLFGRIGPDTGLAVALHMVVVMGFVNSLGAAAAKLIL